VTVAGGDGKELDWMPAEARTYNSNHSMPTTIGCVDPPYKVLAG
jgi:hypothetical protein